LPAFCNSIEDYKKYANQTDTDLQKAFDKKMQIKTERDADRHQNNKKLNS
jgi:NTP pyrophosphatase (non-canonical NTP hydrolase)